MLALQCKTQVFGEIITMRYRNAANIQEAINGFAQYIQQEKGVNLLNMKLPLDIKLVPCND